MGTGDSILDEAALAELRALLAPAPQRERLWPALTAALALALVSIVFACAMIAAPPVVKEHTIQDAPG